MQSPNIMYEVSSGVCINNSPGSSADLSLGCPTLAIAFLTFRLDLLFGSDVTVHRVPFTCNLAGFCFQPGDQLSGLAV